MSVILLIALLAVAWGWLYWLPARNLSPTPQASQPSVALSIARTYQQTGDLGQAYSDLTAAGLGVGDVVAQAQRLAAQNGAVEDIRALGDLAQAIQQGVTSLPPTLTPNLPTEVPTAVPTLTVSLVPSPQVTDTLLPSPSPYAPEFLLIERTPLCSETPTPALLQIYVRDVNGQPLRGISLFLQADGVQDRFYTGLKPEIDIGYADYQMQEGLLYRLEIGQGTPAVQGLLAENCTSADGLPFAGSLRLVFQKVIP